MASPYFSNHSPILDTTTTTTTTSDPTTARITGTAGTPDPIIRIMAAASPITIMETGTVSGGTIPTLRTEMISETRITVTVSDLALILSNNKDSDKNIRAPMLTDSTTSSPAKTKIDLGVPTTRTEEVSEIIKAIKARIEVRTTETSTTEMVTLIMETVPFDQTILTWFAPFAASGPVTNTATVASTRAWSPSVAFAVIAVVVILVPASTGLCLSSSNHNSLSLKEMEVPGVARVS
jgi:hypothetical protein